MAETIFLLRPFPHYLCFLGTGSVIAFRPRVACFTLTSRGPATGN